MNRQEVSNLLAAAAVVDQMAPQPHELVLTVWTSLLHDIPANAAERALMEWYRTNTATIQPAWIVTWYRDRKREHLSNMDQVRAQQAAVTGRPALPMDPGRIHAGVDKAIARLAATKAIGAGANPQDAADEAEGESAVRRAVRSVPCPYPPCGVPAGAACVGPGGKALTKTPAHPARMDAAFPRENQGA